MSHETAILQLILAKGLGTVKQRDLLKKITNEERTLEDLVSSDDLIHYGLKDEMAQAVKTNRDRARQLADELQKQEIHILILGRPDYPTHLMRVLGEKAPPVLFAKGNRSILEQKAVGFCGSRKTSEKGLQIARNVLAASLPRASIL